MKNFLLIVFVVIVTLVCNSCKESNTEPVYATKVEIIAPSNNQRVSDTFYVALGVSNLENINKIEYYVDNILHGIRYYPPLTSYPVVASQYQDSSAHVIQAKVYCSTNTIYETQKISVITYKFMPSNLTGSVVNDSTLRVVWQDNSLFESGYEIFLSSNDTTYHLAATVKSNVTECTLKGKFIQSDMWYVKVRAVNGMQQSAFAKCTVITFALTQPQITSFTTVADSMCEIKWTDNNNFEDNYIIEISGIWQGTVSKNSTSAVIKCNLPVNSYLNIRVGAQRGNVITYSYGYNHYVYFNAPWSFKITPSSVSSVKLQWEDASNFEAGFQIERKLITQSLYTQIGVVGPNVTSYTDNTADTLQQYTYRVRAYTAKNNYSAYSSQLNVGFNLSVQIDKFFPLTGITNSPSLLINNKVFAATSTGFKEFNFGTGSLIRKFEDFPDTGFFSYNRPAVQSRGLFAANDYYHSMMPANPSNMVCIWNAATGNVHAKIASQKSMQAIGFMSDNNTVVLSTGGTFYLYDMTTLAQTGTWENPYSGPILLDDQNDLIYTAESGLVIKIDIKTGGLSSFAITDARSALSLTPDCKYMAVKCLTSLKIVDLTTNSVILTIPFSPVPTLANYIPENNSILFYNGVNNFLFDIATGKKVALDGYSLYSYYFCYRQGKLFAVSYNGYTSLLLTRAWVKL